MKNLKYTTHRNRVSCVSAFTICVFWFSLYCCFFIWIYMNFNFFWMRARKQQMNWWFYISSYFLVLLFIRSFVLLFFIPLWWYSFCFNFAFFSTLFTLFVSLILSRSFIFICFFFFLFLVLCDCMFTSFSFSFSFCILFLGTVSHFTPFAGFIQSSSSSVFAFNEMAYIPVMMRVRVWGRNYNKKKINVVRIRDVPF